MLLQNSIIQGIFIPYPQELSFQESQWNTVIWCPGIGSIWGASQLKYFSQTSFLLKFVFCGGRLIFSMRPSYLCIHATHIVFSHMTSPSMGAICCLLQLTRNIYSKVRLPCCELNIHMSTDFLLNQSLQGCYQKRYQGKIWWVTAAWDRSGVWLSRFHRFTLLPLYSQSCSFSAVMKMGVIFLHLQKLRFKTVSFPSYFLKCNACWP